MYILLFIQSFYIQLKESIARCAIVVIIGTTFNRNVNPTFIEWTA